MLDNVRGVDESLVGSFADFEVARRSAKPSPHSERAACSDFSAALLTGLRLSELIGLNLGAIDGRPGERRITVVGKGRQERTVPIEASLERVIDHYMETRRTRFPGVKLGPKAPLFVDRRGDPLKRGGAHYL